MDIFVDFETRSIVDLPKHGIARYARDYDTLPLMLAFGNIHNGYEQWVCDLPIEKTPTIPDDLQTFVSDETVRIHAHNAPFEIYVWHYICHGRWGWPDIPLYRWYCTMAKAGYSNQPQSLDKLLKRLELPEEYWKDSKGKKLIQYLSLPTKAQIKEKVPVLTPDGKPAKQADGRHNIYVDNTKSRSYAEKQGHTIFTIPGKKGEYFFREDADLMEDYRQYNIQDIVAEEKADTTLPPMSEQERRVWLLDRKINWVGIPIDRQLCEGAIAVFQQEKDCVQEHCKKLTNGRVRAGTQIEKILKWINERVDFGESLSKHDVDRFLDSYDGRRERWGRLNAPEEDVEAVISLLHLRKTVGGSAVAKYQAALDFANEDDRVREQLRYYGAATGRWAGRGIQPHNFKRGSTPDETAIDVIRRGSHEEVEFHASMLDMSVLEFLSACVRGLIMAPAGRKLIVSDFAGIEGRVLHWLVGATHRLDMVDRGVDSYKHTATKIYGCSYDSVTKDQRQIGKAAELGLGYGMGWRTFLAGAIQAGQEMTEEFAQHVVKVWRDDNPKVKSFWWDLDKLAKQVVRLGRRNGKIARKMGKLTVGYDSGRKYLVIRLPSGRNLYYYDPIVIDDDMGGQLYYKDGGKAGPPEFDGRITTYGGKLTENIVQALARDLLVHSMLTIDNAGLRIIFHVHDEVVVEVDHHDDRSFQTVHNAMKNVPDWADGLPLEAETYEARRYRK